MSNIEFNLGEFPYLVSTHSPPKHGWRQPYVDRRLRLNWPIPILPATSETYYGLINVLPQEEQSGIWFCKNVCGDPSKLGIPFSEMAPLRDITFKKDDVPLCGLPIITFGWSGIPLIQAYPIICDIQPARLNRGELATITKMLIEQYFKWAIKEGHKIPMLPSLYECQPLEFLRKYVRIGGLMKLGDGSWTPFLLSDKCRSMADKWWISSVSDGTTRKEEKDNAITTCTIASSVPLPFNVQIMEEK